MTRKTGITHQTSATGGNIAPTKTCDQHFIYILLKLFEAQEYFTELLRGTACQCLCEEEGRQPVSFAQ
jgi:hypothetical protein